MSRVVIVVTAGPIALDDLAQQRTPTLEEQGAIVQLHRQTCGGRERGGRMLQILKNLRGARPPVHAIVADQRGRRAANHSRIGRPQQSGGRIDHMRLCLRRQPSDKADRGIGR